MLSFNSLISVVIPVYNGDGYLQKAIESVLAQTYQPLEVIVVNDGSTDQSFSIAKQFPSINVITQVNSGAGSARNNGVAVAKGEWLAFLDADDLWLPEKLSLQMNVFAANPCIDMVFGGIELFNSPELMLLPFVEKSVVEGFHVGTLLIHREKFAHVGGFFTDKRLGEFIDWYARAQDVGLQTFMLPDVVMKRRRHNSNMTLSTAHDRGEYLKVLKTAINRRRQQG
jgi:glycosyltransferase involved in cell wall biosynthesis